MGGGWSVLAESVDASFEEDGSDGEHGGLVVGAGEDVGDGGDVGGVIGEGVEVGASAEEGSEAVAVAVEPVAGVALEVTCSAVSVCSGAGEGPAEVEQELILG